MCSAFLWKRASLCACILVSRLAYGFGFGNTEKRKNFRKPETMNLNSNQEIEVDGFVDDDELLTCLDNLLFADGDMDLKLDRFEYSDFIALESGLRVSAPFEDLDLEFVAIYYAEACTTCYDETNYDECCVGDDAHIDLEGDDPDRLFSTVVYVCGSVNEVLDDMFPDRMEPTASPTSLTASPTTEPTLVPETSQPTTTPTTGPTHMATVPGTQSPTTTPSFSPTTATPTMVPTDEPTRSPVVTERPTSSTELPTLGPTDQPTTAVPTGTPTSSPSSTPTASPTSNPTGTPTEFPTDLPTATPTTAAPTATPTTAAPTGELRPTANPTRTMRPTSSPTAVPTLVPLSQLPTGTPTSAPSTTPTSSPTVMATAFPSLTPSDLPSLLPTGNPDLLCVSFSYQLNNLTGLTPEDILEERNNTLKTGLELAGRNVTIEILNATFPRDQETLVEESEEVPPQSPGFEFHSFRNKHPHHQRYSHMNENGEDRRVRKLDGYFAAVELGVASTFGLDQAQAMLDSSVEVWSSRIPSQEDLNRRLDSSRRSSRRLVFYTDEYPNEVRNVIENPLCEAPEGIICMIVQQVSCVLLEEGDDPEVVRFTLRNGLRDAINNRDFVEAIPPEHIP